jgi:membrane protein implicated in regulation of membrane protease activity
MTRSIWLRLLAVVVAVTTTLLLQRYAGDITRGQAVVVLVLAVLLILFARAYDRKHRS